MKGRRIRGGALALGLVMLLAGAPRAAAGHAPAGGHALLADELVRTARRVLAGAEAPAEHQLVRSAVLLDLALELAPDDAELWRLRRELAQRQNDAAGQEQALRAYCRLRPRDDAAQLDLILLGLRRRQTLHERMAVLEQMLEDPAAAALSAALRARLALHLAQGAIELGQERVAQRWLRRALELDSANVPAAWLAYQWALARDPMSAQTAEAALALVRAAPLQSQPRVQLAQALLARAAYGAAAEQLDAAAVLAPAGLDAALAGRWALCLAASQQEPRALALLDHLAGGPEGRLPPDLELLRLLLRQGRQEQRAQASFAALVAELEARAAGGDEQARGDALWLKVFFGRGLPAPAEGEAPWLAELRQRAAEDLVAARTLAWVQWRRGEAGARELLARLAQADALAAYGLALLEMGEPAERAASPPRGAPAGSAAGAGSARLAELALRQPASLAALLAMRQLQARGVVSVVGGEGNAMLRQLRQWPALLAHPHHHHRADPDNPPAQAWFSLAAGAPRTSLGYLDPLVLRVTLRNATDMPLSVGPDGALPARLLVSLAPPAEAGAAEWRAAPLVVDLQRRLRLEGRAALELDVRLDRGDLGDWLARRPAEDVSLRATLLLDPQPGSDGRLRAGPRGAAAIAPVFERRGQGVDPQADAAALTAPGASAARFAALARLARSLASADDAGRQRAAAAMAGSLRQMDDLAAAWLLALLPDDLAPLPALAAELENAVPTLGPPAQVVYLARFARDAQSPLLQRLARSDDARVHSFAAAQQAALEHAAPQASSLDAAEK